MIFSGQGASTSASTTPTSASADSAERDALLFHAGQHDECAGEPRAAGFPAALPSWNATSWIVLGHHQRRSCTAACCRCWRTSSCQRSTLENLKARPACSRLLHGQVPAQPALALKWLRQPPCTGVCAGSSPRCETRARIDGAELGDELGEVFHRVAELRTRRSRTAPRVSPSQPDLVGVEVAVDDRGHGLVRQPWPTQAANAASRHAAQSEASSGAPRATLRQRRSISWSQWARWRVAASARDSGCAWSWAMARAVAIGNASLWLRSRHCTSGVPCACACHRVHMSAQ